MLNKSSDRIVAIIPFVFVLAAGVIGMKSDLDLFSWWHFAQASEIPSHTIQYDP